MAVTESSKEPRGALRVVAALPGALLALLPSAS
jgi:hypothetical protein